MKTGNENILSRLRWIASATLLCFLTQNIYSQSIDSLPWKEINKYLKEGIECKYLLQIKNIEIDSLYRETWNRDTLETLLYYKIAEQDTIINRLQQNNNSMVELAAEQYAFIGTLARLKWHERLFKQQKIIKEFKQRLDY